LVANSIFAIDEMGLPSHYSK